MDRTPLYEELLSHLGGPAKAARELGVGQGTASGWRLGRHGMSAGTALKAERITGGRFKAAELSAELAEVAADPAA